MKTLYSLQKELHRLRKHIEEKENAPKRRARAEVNALLSNPQDHGGSFEDACSDSRARVVQRREAEALAYLRKNPAVLHDAWPTDALMQVFQDLSPSSANEVIAAFKKEGE